MTRADKIRAHIQEVDRTLKSLTDDEEITGYLECANLFARLEIAAQLAEANALKRLELRGLYEMQPAEVRNALATMEKS